MTPPPASAIESFTSEVLSVETDGHVATLWLDREEKRNAMGPAFWSDLPRAMAAIGSDPEIRAVVVAARGPHFSGRPGPGGHVGTDRTVRRRQRHAPVMAAPGPVGPGARSSASRPR